MEFFQYNELKPIHTGMLKLMEKVGFPVSTNLCGELVKAHAAIVGNFVKGKVFLSNSKVFDNNYSVFAYGLVEGTSRRYLGSALAESNEGCIFSSSLFGKKSMIFGVAQYFEVISPVYEEYMSTLIMELSEACKYDKRLAADVSAVSSIISNIPPTLGDNLENTVLSHLAVSLDKSEAFQKFYAGFEKMYPSLALAAANTQQMKVLSATVPLASWEESLEAKTVFNNEAKSRLTELGCILTTPMSGPARLPSL